MPDEGMNSLHDQLWVVSLLNCGIALYSQLIFTYYDYKRGSYS